MFLEDLLELPKTAVIAFVNQRDRKVLVIPTQNVLDAFKRLKEVSLTTQHPKEFFNDASVLEIEYYFPNRYYVDYVLKEAANLIEERFIAKGFAPYPDLSEKRFAVKPMLKMVDGPSGFLIELYLKSKGRLKYYIRSFGTMQDAKDFVEKHTKLEMLDLHSRSKSLLDIE